METEKEWAGNGTVLMTFWLHIDRDEQVNYPALSGGASCFMANTCTTEM